MTREARWVLEVGAGTVIVLIVNRLWFGSHWLPIGYLPVAFIAGLVAALAILFIRRAKGSV